MGSHGEEDVHKLLGNSLSLKMETLGLNGVVDATS